MEALGGFDPKAIYDEASRDYEDASRDFWEYISLRTVERLALRSGERVLDVPCGTGAAALRAARQVGPAGSVVGVDYADRMVAIAREKAAAAGVANLEVSVADMTALDPAATGLFDAVVCALGLFFAEDMPALLRRLAALLRPGGRLGVAVFGEQVFEPLRPVFAEAVAELAPDLEVLEPWRRCEAEPVLREVFATAGLTDITVVTDEDRLPLRSPDDWWRIVMGSGLRRTVTAVDGPVAAELRRRGEAYIARSAIGEIVNRSRYVLARVGG
ncbi:MAG TPA: methyltransferase domain-containing protein [Acidimicrobiia bacterium]|nr:methyltransferase domain-containing protein [Acidimicrobiia bacterium]